MAASWRQTKNTSHVNPGDFRDVPINKTQKLMGIEGFPWKQESPNTSGHRAIGDMTHVIMVLVAKKTRGIVLPKSMRRAPSMKPRFQQTSKRIP